MDPLHAESGDRQTSRGGGNCGVRLLADVAGEFTFEPPEQGEGLRFLPVVRLSEDGDRLCEVPAFSLTPTSPNGMRTGSRLLCQRSEDL